MGQTNKIIAHCAGGAAISVADKVLNKVADYGDGFANIEFHYLDTSTANINKIEPRGEFWRVETESNSKGTITGSGQNRAQFAVDISKSVDKYLDKNKFTRPNPFEFHIVISSAGGGTGGPTSAFIINKLLKANIPVIAVVIGDSSTGLMAINTLNSIASLNKIALDNNKPLSVIYVNNHHMLDKFMKDAEEATNKILFSYLSSLALFLSSENEYLDNQDMINFIDQSNYKNLNIQPGLYGIQFFSKDIQLAKDVTPVGGRTLTLENGIYDTGIELFHHKYGIVTDENVINTYSNGFPIHMISSYNYFQHEEANLQAIADKTLGGINSIKSSNVSGTSNSSVDDETGLIL